MKITIYGSPGCPHCYSAKRFFEWTKLPHEYFDITKEDKWFKEAKDLAAKIGSMGLPIISIDSYSMVGFNREKIEEILKSDKPIDEKVQSEIVQPKLELDAPVCKCGGIMIKRGSCYSCQNCFETTGSCG